MARQHDTIAVLVLLFLSICNSAFAWTPSIITIDRQLPKHPNHYLLFHGRSIRPRSTIRFALFRGDNEQANNDPEIINVLPSVSPLAVVRRSLPFYIGLLCLGVLPAIDFVGESTTSSSVVLETARTCYFALFAVTTVYLGAQRQDIGVTQAPVSGEGAATLPLVAASSLAIIYAIIKYTALDVGALYRVLTCIFGWICLTEILQPMVALTGAFSGEEETSSERSVVDVTQKEGRGKEERTSEQLLLPPTASAETIGETESDAARFRASNLPASALSLTPILLYLFFIPSLLSSSDVDVGQLRYLATFNNYIACAIALASLGQVAIDSFVTGAALLLGLFLYDVVSVFGSDAMVTVATKIEAPIKVLFAGATVPQDGKYPFSVLGLGDILAPGVFVAMLRQFDVERWWATTQDYPNNDENTRLFSNINLGLLVIILLIACAGSTSSASTRLRKSRSVTTPTRCEFSVIIIEETPCSCIFLAL